MFISDINIQMFFTIQADDYYLQSLYKTTIVKGNGLDIYAPEDMHLKPGKGQIVDFKVKVVHGNHNSYTPMLLLLRSSTAKNTPIRLANSAGLIDENYRGNIKACFDLDSEYFIERGQRLIQLLPIPSTLPIPFEKSVRVVDKISDTERGAGGFGSTGK